MRMKRRDFLKLSAAGAAGLTLVSVGAHGWAAQNRSGATQRLVVVFLRGAVDGLNVVVPYGDAAYYEMRPTIAIARPGTEGGALGLDGHFGLHPALSPLMPMWKEHSLAFIHASGSPDETRSHFDAQDYMESGTPGIKSTVDGWMNRLLAELPGPRRSTDAVNFGPVMPRILSGKIDVASVASGRAAGKPMVLDRPVVEAAFDSMYAGTDNLSRAYREGQTARKQIMTDLKQEMMAADNGAPSPAGFPDDTARLADLIRKDANVELAFFGLGGWDTHVNQGSAKGQLANHLTQLAEGLAALRTGLGDSWRDTVVIVMSEFGRTAHENGNGGTDHGHGNVMWVMGGPIAGGKVYGRWPGLDEEELHEGRDLAVTTDFRSTIAAILVDHMGLGAASIARVFPDAPLDGTNVKGLASA